jgi:hypothetical protein
MLKVYGFEESFARREQELADEAIDLYYKVHNNIENMSPETMKMAGIQFYDDEGKMWGTEKNPDLVVTCRNKSISGAIHTIQNPDIAIKCEYDGSTGAGVVVEINEQDLKRALHNKGYDYCKLQMHKLGYSIEKAMVMQGRENFPPSVRQLKSQLP